MIKPPGNFNKGHVAPDKVVICKHPGIVCQQGGIVYRAPTVQKQSLILLEVQCAC